MKTPHASALLTYLDELLSTESAPEDQQTVNTEAAEAIAAIEHGEDFSASIADTGAMKLAIPVQNIEAIIDCHAGALSAEAKIAWISGEFDFQQRTIRVVDCEELLNSHKPHEGQKNRILILKNSQWGLLCYSIQQNVSINADSVRWRETLTIKPWLSATIQQFQCALLDVDVLGQWLDQGAPAE